MAEKNIQKDNSKKGIELDKLIEDLDTEDSKQVEILKRLIAIAQDNKSTFVQLKDHGVLRAAREIASRDENQEVKLLVSMLLMAFAAKAHVSEEESVAGLVTAPLKAMIFSEDEGISDAATEELFELAQASDSIKKQLKHDFLLTQLEQFIKSRKTEDGKLRLTQIHKKFTDLLSKKKVEKEEVQKPIQTQPQKQESGIKEEQKEQQTTNQEKKKKKNKKNKQKNTEQDAPDKVDPPPSNKDLPVSITNAGSLFAGINIFGNKAVEQPIIPIQPKNEKSDEDKRVGRLKDKKQQVAQKQQEEETKDKVLANQQQQQQVVETEDEGDEYQNEEEQPETGFYGSDGIYYYFADDWAFDEQGNPCSQKDMDDYEANFEEEGIEGDEQFEEGQENQEQDTNPAFVWKPNRSNTSPSQSSAPSTSIPALQQGNYPPKPTNVFPIPKQEQSAPYRTPGQTYNSAPLNSSKKGDSITAKLRQQSPQGPQGQQQVQPQGQQQGGSTFQYVPGKPSSGQIQNAGGNQPKINQNPFVDHNNYNRK
ncbi:MAG: hypothetical protein EZS28_026871 [Streblomastix strix]|uniref:Uncharacterized protein n=1 Tax=Streblomastix strix TaxID=222440 RepID=A0A5J4V5G5_9EUKA|nr:MAG: hypothetical protein EZS28_026871 [Streblomastix strix]